MPQGWKSPEVVPLVYQVPVRVRFPRCVLPEQDGVLPGPGGELRGGQSCQQPLAMPVSFPTHRYHFIPGT